MIKSVGTIKIKELGVILYILLLFEFKLLQSQHMTAFVLQACSILKLLKCSPDQNI